MFRKCFIIQSAWFGGQQLTFLAEKLEVWQLLDGQLKKEDCKALGFSPLVEPVVEAMSQG
jgi:hypothetical protein